MKAYRIRGRFRMGGSWQAYGKEVAAKDDAAAREKVVSTLGSQHRVPRRSVEIATVEEIPTKDVTDPAVRHALEAGP